jgi:hypothetical protein
VHRLRKEQATGNPSLRNPVAHGRGLHSFTSQLNLSTVHGIGGARRGCVAHVKGVFRVFRVCTVFLCDLHGSS